LRGILPICASCKKIRDDKGYWTQIETYIGRHSEAVFSHGVCPKCIKEQYPDLYPELLKKNPSQLKAQWARQIFTGGAKPPKEMASDDEILKFVASTPGAIAYVDSSKVNKSVKVVKH